MKINRKSVSLCAFLVGAAIFTTSALADVALGSGYTRLKQSVKYTAAQLCDHTDSFTIATDVTVKMDDTVIDAASTVTRINLAADTKEETSSSFDAQIGNMIEYYYYSSPTKYIHHASGDDTYYVTERTEKQGSNHRENPFEEDMVKDGEKIVDALVGSLQDLVQVEETDGKCLYFGNLAQAQVPPLINAVTGFFTKYALLDSYSFRERELPEITSDICVNEVTGKAIENADGMLESIIVRGSVTGNDESGTPHTITLDISGTLSDVNSTHISEPDLSNEKTKYSVEANHNLVEEKYVGRYTGNIIGEQNGAYIKKGECVVEITSITGESITGRYHENIASGMEERTPLSFEFTTNSADRYGNNVFEYTDGEGKTCQGVLSFGGNATVRMQLGVDFYEEGGYSSEHIQGYPHELQRVFE